MTWNQPDQNDSENEVDEMSRMTDSQSADMSGSPVRPGSQPVRRSLEGKFVCPFCGTINARTDEPCPSCGMDNTPATRNSTRGRVGPWYVLQKRNPAAPGMKFETLVKFIRKGRIQPRAVLRGPTTSQLWRFAATVKGISREFGLCYNCGGDIEPTTDHCPHCGRDQQPPVDPDALLENRAVVPAPARPKVSLNDSRADFDFNESDDPGVAPVAPVVAKPFKQSPPPAPKQPVPITPTAAFNAVLPISNPLPSKFPPITREESDRREIEAGRIAREQEPRDPNKAAPTLSARELATAFQLDFTPTNSKRRRGKSHKGLWAFLLLVALGGAGAYAWFNVPQFHDGLKDLYTQASTKIQSMVNTPASTAKPATPAINPNLMLQAHPQPSGESPKPTDQSAKAGTPNGTPVMAPPEVVAPPIAVKPTPPPAPKISLDEAYGLSHKLWGEALDHESRGEWAEAISAFEQIKALPPKAWPSSLDLHLTQAKAKLGQ
ncbi:hypothetical protein BH10PLA1_BH10PLA1_13360 [soil metagenome]